MEEDTIFTFPSVWSCCYPGKQMKSVYQNRGKSVVLQTTDSEYWFLHTNRRQQADDEWILSQRGCMIFGGEDGRLLLTVTRLYTQYDSFAKQQSNNCNEIVKYNYVLHTLQMLCAFSRLAWWAMDGGMQGKVISFGLLFLDWFHTWVCVWLIFMQYSKIAFVHQLLSFFYSLFLALHKSKLGECQLHNFK